VLDRGETLVKFVAYIFGGLLLAGSLTGLILGTVNFFTIFFLVMGIALIGLGYKSGKNKSDSALDPLEKWLITNRTEILENGGNYRGHRIDRDTEIVRYLFVCSFVLFTAKIPSRWYVHKSENTAVAASAYTLGSAIAGWWGFPWGPVYTAHALYRNLRGGYRYSVSEFFGQGSRRPV
jgi:hypothetical protein